MIQINKSDLVSYILKELEKDLESNKKISEQSKQVVVNAPTRMQSRYDTMGVEAAWLADGLALRVSELERDIYEMKKLQIPEYDGEARLCSIVSVKNLTIGESAVYIILPITGGKEIYYNGVSVTVISPDSPITRALFGKKKGDKFEMKIQKRTIEYLVEDVL